MKPEQLGEIIPQITVTGPDGEVVAVVTKDSVVEHKGYRVILS